MLTEGRVLLSHQIKEIFAFRQELQCLLVSYSLFLGWNDIQAFKQLYFVLMVNENKVDRCQYGRRHFDHLSHVLHWRRG